MRVHLLFAFTLLAPVPVAAQTIPAAPAATRAPFAAQMLAGSWALRVDGAIGDWIELSFADLRSGGIPDVFRFHLIAPDRAELIYADTGLAPFTLERVA